MFLIMAPLELNRYNEELEATRELCVGKTNILDVMEPGYGAYHHFKVANDNCMENRHVSSQKLKRNSVNFYKMSEKEI